MTRRFPAMPSVFRVTAAVAGGVVAVWVLGFVAFFLLVVASGPENPDRQTDVVVVLTGGPGRIEQGFALMADDKAKAMLVTGVHPNVSLRQLLDRWAGGDADRRARLNSHCCIFIEHKAETTEDNAAETLGWLGRNGGPDGVSVRLVTADYHMPRAMLLFDRAMPGAELEAWPVKSPSYTSWAFLRQMLIEYSKTFLMWLA